MTMLRTVVVRTQFSATHSCPADKCTSSVNSFLVHKHRHLFKVEVKARVTDSDREIEFLDLLDTVEAVIAEYFPEDLGHKSCEMIAEEIMEKVREQFPTTFFASVFEDGENGAELWRVEDE